MDIDSHYQRWPKVPTITNPRAVLDWSMAGNSHCALEGEVGCQGGQGGGPETRLQLYWQHKEVHAWLAFPVSLTCSLGFTTRILPLVMCEMSWLLAICCGGHSQLMTWGESCQLLMCWFFCFYVSRGRLEMRGVLRAFHSFMKIEQYHYDNHCNSNNIVISKQKIVY